MSKNSVKQRIKHNLNDKCKRPLTGDFKKDIPWVLQYSEDISNFNNESALVSLKDYVKLNMPNVYDEMMSDTEFAKWVDNNHEVMGIIHLTYDDKIVGYMNYMVSMNLMGDRSILIENVYVLEEYRGKQIASNYLKELYDYLQEYDSYYDVLLTFSDPSYGLICSLKKAGLILENQLYPHLLFSLPTLVAFKDNAKIPRIQTNFYDVNLKAPVQCNTVGDGSNVALAVGKLLVIDKDDVAESYRKNDSYMKKLCLQIIESKDYFRELCR